MARLIPKIDVEAITNGGERDVARALSRLLPADCVAYHSYPWLRRNRSDYSRKDHLQEGETDFVVIDPDYGLLVLEVKGGTIRFDPSDHCYYRDEDGCRIQNPFDQARKNLHAVRELLLAHEALQDGRLPFPFGYAVAFPHCRYAGPLPADADQAIILTADDLGDLGRRVREALAAWARRTSPPRITVEVRDAIQEALSPVFRLTPVLWRTVEEQEDRLRRLTRDQEAFLTFAAGQPRAAIEGVAGSGKTLLALAQAQRFARAGKRTLLVCYNRPLADWLCTRLPDKFASSITIDTFHGVAARFCKAAKIRFDTSRDDDAFWDETAPELLEQACDLAGDAEKFDALVVDEGQDFREFWWMALERTVRGGPAAPLYVFYDPKQNIYIMKPTLPGGLAGPFVLPTNCRNTRRIAGACGEIIETAIDVHEDAPEGEVPLRAVASDEADVIRRVERQIQEWCLKERGGLGWDKVAILTPTEPGKDWPAKFGNIPLTRHFERWREGKGVLLSTHRRFKGLETDALILAGVPKPGSKEYFSRADYYVACSRAKHLLSVISSEPL